MQKEYEIFKMCHNIFSSELISIKKTRISEIQIKFKFEKLKREHSKQRKKNLNYLEGIFLDK